METCAHKPQKAKWTRLDLQGAIAPVRHWLGTASACGKSNSQPPPRNSY